MSTKLSRSYIYRAICDRCGFKKYSYELRQEWTGLMVCKKCWEARHVLDFYRPRNDTHRLPWIRSDGDYDETLRFTATIAGGGNCYSYWRISVPNYTIPTSACYLKYDVRVVSSTSDATKNLGGIEIDLSAPPTTGRQALLVDQFGYPINAPLYTDFSWHSRYISIHGGLNSEGTTIQGVDLVIETDVPGTYIVDYRNIRIEDAGIATGTVLKSIWTSGAPSTNSLAYHSGASGESVADTMVKE